MKSLKFAIRLWVFIGAFYVIQYINLYAEIERLMKIVFVS